MWLLKLRHWQVFTIIFVAVIMQNFTFEGYPEITSIITLVGYLVYYLWPLLVGDTLHKIAGKRFDLNNNTFIICGLIWLLTISSIVIFTDGASYRFTGIQALPGLLVVVAYCYYISYPAKALKTLEIGNDIEVGSYIGDFFLIVFLPIGIWFLQPRLNKIAAKNVLLTTLDVESE